MQQKIKLGITANGLSPNGVTKMIYNYTRKLPHNSFEIAIFNSGDADSIAAQQFSDSDIMIVDLPVKQQNPFQYLIALVRELRVFSPDVVHVNGSSALMSLELIGARLSPAKARIAHCHSNSSMHPILNVMLRPVTRLLSNGKLACSVSAGNSVFKVGSFDVLPNAFEIERFAFDQASRERVRHELNIPPHALVLGHVGRVNEVKNQRFAVEIFEEVCHKRDDAYIVFVGEGPGMRALQEKIEASPNKERIILTGNQTDTAPYYSAFDALVFPSLYEGLGITVLEAQASGLPCIISSGLPQEVDAGGRIVRVGLSEAASIWAKTIEKELDGQESCRRERGARLIESYDINRCSESLEAYYRALADCPVSQIKSVRLVMS